MRARVLAITAFLLVLAAMGCSVAMAWADQNFDWPPVRFKGVGIYVVRTMSPADVSPYCHEMGAARVDAAGCYIPWLREIVLMDPCATPSAGFSGRLLCHEIGHANGWPGNHPR